MIQALRRADRGCPCDVCLGHDDVRRVERVRAVAAAAFSSPAGGNDALATDTTPIRKNAGSDASAAALTDCRGGVEFLNGVYERWFRFLGRWRENGDEHFERENDDDGKNHDDAKNHDEDDLDRLLHLEIEVTRVYDLEYALEPPSLMTMSAQTMMQQQQQQQLRDFKTTSGDVFERFREATKGSLHLDVAEKPALRLATKPLTAAAVRKRLLPSWNVVVEEAMKRQVEENWDEE